MKRKDCFCWDENIDLSEYEVITKRPDGRILLSLGSNGELTVLHRDNEESFKDEHNILEELMCRNFDKYHIVKFYGWLSKKKALLFETLDIDLEEYVITNLNTLSLNDIRNIIQQIATALDVLSLTGVIHGNVSPKNILLEDGKTRPLRVKLTNFTSARLSSDDRKATELPDDLTFVAPEVFSGQPLSEPADMWCLGRVALFLLGSCERYKQVVERLTHPEDNHADEEMTECFRLLKAMMSLNPEERITPVDVLTHPFILRGYYPWANDYNSYNSDSESDSENCKVAKTVRDKFYLNHLNYEIMEKLGRKCFGPIRKCWNHQTGEYVAVKRPLNWPCSSYEMMLLKELLDEGCELHNIVKCHGWFDFLVGKAPVFELLDKDIGSILKESQKPMLLSDIRVIIQQMAEALLFLKERKIIHCNITPHHIMTVDEKRPLRVKLIDFGFATYSNDRDGVYATGIQSPCYSAPEMILDYPQSAATDMWSLGCVMAEMVLGRPLFPEDPDGSDSDDSYRDDSDSEDCGPGSNTAVLAQMVKYLGMPPDHVIDEGGVGSNLYFRKTTSNKWIHRELPQEKSSILLPTGQSLKSLDDLKSMRLEVNNGFEALEREQCIELLKAMLKMDPKKRITPEEVLNHPFIKADHKPATCSEPTSLQPDHSSLPPTLLPLDVTMEKMEEEKKKTTKWFLLCFSRKKNISPPGVTMEKMERKKEEKKKKNCFLLCCPRKNKIAPPGVTMEKTAEKKNWFLHCCTKKKKITPSDIVMVPAAAPQVDHDKTRSQEDHDCPPAATLPPGVIMVQPAPPERRFTTVNEGRPGSLQTVPHMVYTCQSETEKIYSLTPVRV